MYASETVTDLAEKNLPVSIKVVKSYLGMTEDMTEMDDEISTAMLTAVDVAEGELGANIVTRLSEVVYDHFPAGGFATPLGPLILPAWGTVPANVIDSFNLRDEDDNTTAVSSSLYYIDDYKLRSHVLLNKGSIWPSTTLWPTRGVIFRGYMGLFAGPALVAPQLIAALLFLTAHYFHNRLEEAVKEGISSVKLDRNSASLLSRWKKSDEEFA